MMDGSGTETLFIVSVRERKSAHESKGKDQIYGL